MVSIVDSFPDAMSMTCMVASSEWFSDTVYATRFPSHDTDQPLSDLLPSVLHVFGSSMTCSSAVFPFAPFAASRQ